VSTDIAQYLFPGEKKWSQLSPLSQINLISLWKGRLRHGSSQRQIQFFLCGLKLIKIWVSLFKKHNADYKYKFRYGSEYSLRMSKDRQWNTNALDIHFCFEITVGNFSAEILLDHNLTSPPTTFDRSQYSQGPVREGPWSSSVLSHSPGRSAPGSSHALVC
jgi:hypothetical protein